MKNLIVGALTSNIEKAPELLKSTEYAVKALQYALPYAAQNFKVSSERDFIMAKLFDALTIPVEDIRVVAMQTLVDISKQEYESIEFYFPKICEVTAVAARTDE
jgi:hypothetical protein